MSLTHDILKKSSFDPYKAEIYLILAENGQQTVPQILTKTTLSRTTVYQILNELLANGFIEYEKRGRVAYYNPTHPNKLYQLVEEKRQDATLFEKEMKEVIEQLTATFNLHTKKPGMRFFEGRDGIRTALFDSLTATGEIYTFVEGGVVEKYINDLNEEYVAERLRRGIPKKIITTDTPASRKHNERLTARQALTTIKFVDADKYPFRAAVQIYNDSVLYLSLSDENLNAYLIKNELTAEFHKSIFRALWDGLPPAV